MGDTGFKYVVFAIITSVLILIVGIKYIQVFPRVEEGRVVLLEHRVWPFDTTTITFTTLGGADELTLGGSWDLEVGVVYRIEYYTPFWYLYAVPSSITLTGVG